MSIIEKIRNNRIIKILIAIFLFIIIFDKLIILSLITVYYVVNKYIFKKDMKNPLEMIKILTNRNRNKNEGYSNLGIDDDILLESYENDDILINKLSNIFKGEKYNLGEYPNVEIKEGDILFKDNKFLPECCMYYSDYSSDRGCPCITPEQQNYLQRRGLNRSKDSFIHEYDLKNLFFFSTNSFKGNKDDIFIKHNTYIKRGAEELSDSSINEVYSLLNMQER